MRIALATNREYPELVEGEVLLLKAFKDAGYDVCPAIWDSPDINWGSFDQVVIRSCWGYHRVVEKFYSWIDMLVTLGVSVHNSPHIVKWNSHKRYLIELEKLGLPIPQTILIPKNDGRLLDEVAAGVTGERFVIKPCYGASSEGITMVDKRRLSQADDTYRTLLQTGDVLLQEFMPEVEQGEISAIFFNNQFSHAVLKTPKRGEFRTNISRGGSEHLLKADQEMVEQINELYRLCHKDVLYARLDLVNTVHGLCLMELELIEPYLFFDFWEDSASRFVEAFEQRLTRTVMKER